MSRNRLSLATFRIEAPAAADTGTIEGRVVPFGEEFTRMGARLVFSRGGLRLPADLSNVKLLIQHDDERPVGYAIEAVEHDDGWRMKFQLADHPRAADLVVEIEENLRDAFSVGVLLDEDVCDAMWDAMWDGQDEPINATGEIREVSSVSLPQFNSARVGTSAGRLVHLSATPEGSTTMDEDTTTAAAETEAPPVATGSPAVITRGEFPYGPAHRNRSYFRDLYRARREGDVEAAARVALADQMVRAAQDRGDLPEVIPPGYRPDLYLAQIEKRRPIVAAFASGGITDATPFTIPRFVSGVGLAAENPEGEGPTDGTLDFDPVIVTPKAYSGRYAVSREMLDAANPALDGIIRTALAEAYSQVTEVAANTALQAPGQGQGLGTIVGTTGNVVEGGLRAELAKFPGRRLAPAEVILVAPSEYELLVTANSAADGRPLMAYLNPMNASGSVGSPDGILSILGVPVESAWAITTTKSVVARRGDFITFESPRQEFRFDEVEGPQNIVFAQYAYFAGQVMRGDGITLVSRSAAAAAAAKA